MSITDELREWVNGAKPAVVDGCSISVGTMTYGCKKALLAIADRIDAEHERAMADAYLSGTPTDEKLAELGWVRLPVDADGEPIHAGDVVQFRHDAPVVVTMLRLIKKHWGEPTWDFIGENAAAYSLNCMMEIRHHHAPTVEDVLREFAERYMECADAANWQDIIADFASRLRLREDA